MTRTLRIRFPRLVLILAIVPGIIAVALATSAAAASASPSWNQPPPPQQVCEYSLLTEHDTVADVPGSDQQQQYGNQWAGEPSSAPTAYPMPNGGYGHHSDQVTVEQVVKFCVTEGKHGQPDTVKVWDVTEPFAWVSESDGQYSPTPSGYSSAMAPFLHS